MKHLYISIPVYFLLGSLFLLIFPIGYEFMAFVVSALMVLSMWYGRERRDNEIHYKLNPFDYKNRDWWLLLLPWNWYSGSKEDFNYPFYGLVALTILITIFLLLI